MLIDNRTQFSKIKVNDKHREKFTKQLNRDR